MWLRFSYGWSLLVVSQFGKEFASAVNFKITIQRITFVSFWFCQSFYSRKRSFDQYILLTRNVRVRSYLKSPEEKWVMNFAHLHTSIPRKPWKIAQCRRQKVLVHLRRFPGNLALKKKVSGIHNPFSFWTLHLCVFLLCVSLSLFLLYNSKNWLFMFLFWEKS